MRQIEQEACRHRPSCGPVRRIGETTTTPLTVAALEDKIVQQGVGHVLNAVQKLLGVSYGFRPAPSTHDVIDALYLGFHGEKIASVLDTNMQYVLRWISQNRLIRFLEHRITDRRVVHLIQKSLQGGSPRDRIVTVDDENGPGS